MIEIFLTAVSLALDALAVSVATGLTLKNFRLRHALLMGVYFGGFQFIMPLIGWFLGSTVAEYVSKISPWLSFLLLAAIGGKMIWGAVRGGDEAEGMTKLTHTKLLVLAVATSIDALAVGVTFAFREVSIWLACAVIGIVAFVLSVLGGMFGSRLGGSFQKRAELVGGLVLVGIGIKILVQSLL